MVATRARPAGVARIEAGDVLKLNLLVAIVATNNSPITVEGRARLIYDDGSTDVIHFYPKAFAGVSSGSAATGLQGDKPATQGGYVVSWLAQTDSPAVNPANCVWGLGVVQSQVGGQISWAVVASGPIIGNANLLAIGEIVPITPDLWPIWVFQGTILEDGTAGTHVCTLTITPGAGGVFDLLYCQLISEGLAAQAFSGKIMDGSGNTLTNLFSNTSQGTNNVPGAISGASGASAGVLFRVSGAMQLVLNATTSTVSDTQTFGVVLRFHPAYLPTATLADSVGSPTLTVNTQAVF